MEEFISKSSPFYEGSQKEWRSELQVTIWSPAASETNTEQSYYSAHVPYLSRIETTKKRYFQYDDGSINDQYDTEAPAQ